MITKKIWARNILGCVRRIADPEYQERAWIKHELNWPCSFGELMCQLFDDALVEAYIEEYSNGSDLSKEQLKSLKEFVEILDVFSDKTEISSPHGMIDGAKVLADPEWPIIRKLAKRVLNAFGNTKYDVEDKEDQEWWRDSILRAIRKYSDIHEQNQMWLDKTEVFYSTPRDMYKKLFDDVDFERFIDAYAEKFGLTKQQIGALNKFRLQLKKTPFDTTHFEDLLSNPEWQKIQALAKEVIDLFHINT